VSADAEQRRAAFAVGTRNCSTHKAGGVQFFHSTGTASGGAANYLARGAVQHCWSAAPTSSPPNVLRQSANVQIGVAKAAYFQNLPLSTSGGFQSSSFAD